MQLNLINFLTVYLVLMFILSTWRRMQQYGEMGNLVMHGPVRWPKLLGLIKEHRMIFLTWKTVAPSALALILMALQFVAASWFWPQAAEPPHGLTLENLLHHPFMVFVVVPLAIGVLTIDIYFLINVGSIDRPMLEKYFDQAEYWLNSRLAGVVKIVTFGKINPRRMVADEVRKALIDASDVLNTTLWWTTLQVGLRFAFGVSLWITWALG